MVIVWARRPAIGVPPRFSVGERRPRL